MPTIEDLVEVLSSSSSMQNNDEWCTYLNKLHNEYCRKGKEKLYDIQIDDIEDNRPPEFDANKSKYLYEKFVRGKLFQKFPTHLNIHNQEICPICEGVFSAKVTLEHIIPKGVDGDYRLGILPINLIKCCGECNTPTHSKKSNCEKNSEISPYFEGIDIIKYLEISFEEIEQRYLPKVEFSYEENIYDQRVNCFIDNYNIKKTYNHRVSLEYQKILTTLAYNPGIKKKSSLRSFIERKQSDYKENCDFEKIGDTYWIDQNYFGYLICGELVKNMGKDCTVFDKINEGIQEIRKSTSNVILSNLKFYDCLEAVTTVKDLQDFIENNKEDVIVYRDDRRKHGLSIEFPNLFNLEDNLGKKIMVEKIFDYYINCNKDFSDFEENCTKILE